MRDRIEFVGMALRALKRHAQYTLADAVDPIEHFHHAELLGNNRSLLVDHAIAQETRRDDLLLSRLLE